MDLNDLAWVKVTAASLNFVAQEDKLVRKSKFLSRHPVQYPGTRAARQHVLPYLIIVGVSPGLNP